MAHEEALYRPIAEDVAPLPESRAQLLNSHVPLPLKKTQDHIALRLDTPRAAVPAKRLRAGVSLLARQPTPAAHTRRAYTKTRTGRSMAQARRNRRQNTIAKIKGKGFRHLSRPPQPGQHLEAQITRTVNPRENPNRFNQIRSRSNAGTYIRFGAEDFTVEKFRDQIDTNVMGTVNCLAPVIEAMKPRRRGRIAIVSSLTAYRGLPMASAYGASKAALTNMGEALRPELEQFGITLSIVHPGFVRTPLTERNEFPMPFLMEPDIAARRIVKGLEQGQFEITMPRRFAYLLKIGRCLPYRLYFAITRRMIGG